MKFKRFMGLVLAVMMVMSCFTVGSFAATQDLQETKSMTINYGTPTVDGQLDDVWADAASADFPYDRNGASESNLASLYDYGEATKPWVKVLWDEGHIYAYFRVYDDNIVYDADDSVDRIYNNDSVELYIDEYNDKSTSVGDCTRYFQICVRADGAKAKIQGDSGEYNYAASINEAAGYYDVEISADIDRDLAKGNEIGIDFAINCNDTPGEAVRAHSLSWNDRTNKTWKNASYMGEATLADPEGAFAETYAVTYDANGGEGAPLDQTKTADVELTLSTDVPSRVGYTFKGWSTAADGAVEYAAGASYTANAAVTLYAVWEYTFDESVNALPEGIVASDEGWVKDKNLAETTIKWQVYTEGEDQVIKFTLWPAEDGKVSTSVLYAVIVDESSNQYKMIATYAGGKKTEWGLEYGTTATKVIVGEGITAIAGGFVEGFSALKAVELPTTLTTLMDRYTFGQCSALSSIYVTGTDPVAKHVDISGITSIMTGYTFDGSRGFTSITLSENLTGHIREENFKNSRITEITIPAGVESIYAEAFEGCSSLTKVVIMGMNTTIAQYAFASKSDGTNDLKDNITIYCYAGSTAEANAKEYGFNYELLEDEPAEYTVTYDANGGEDAPLAQTKIEDVELTLSTDVPTYTGYTFKGWSTTANGEVEYVAGATYTANADVTLYAVWEAAVVEENIVTGNSVTDWSNNLWSFNKTTKVLTITSNKTGYNETGSYKAEDGWKDYLTEIEEIVLVGNISKISNSAFWGTSNLRKVTLSKNITQIDAGAFFDCSKLETICIEGSPVIEGVLDFSNIMGSNAKGSSSFAKAEIFNSDTISTAIILSSKYSDVPSVEGDASSAPALNLDYLPNNVQAIYGATEYLEAFAAANNLEFVPFGKSTDKNIYWTIEDGVMTLVGEGALNGLDSAVNAYAADVKTVIIPATITEITDGALAALTALESATFEGDAPTVAEDAKPFGAQSDSFVINVSRSAEGFEGDTWCGYELSKPEFEYGDVNSDGKIDTKDVVLLAQYVAEWGVEINEAASDVDLSGKLDTKDIILIAQSIAGWDVTLGDGNTPGGGGSSGGNTPGGGGSSGGDTPEPEVGDNEVEADDLIPNQN